MRRLHLLLPHVLTALAIAATIALFLHYATTAYNQARLTEIGLRITNWDVEMLELTFQDGIGGREPLPCPALAQRTVQGTHDTYTLNAVVTRAHPPTTEEGEPTATCEETPFYLIEMTAGWPRSPEAWQLTIINDIALAQKEPQRLMRPYIRQDVAPFTVTALSAAKAIR